MLHEHVCDQLVGLHALLPLKTLLGTFGVPEARQLKSTGDHHGIEDFADELGDHEEAKVAHNLVRVGALQYRQE